MINRSKYIIPVFVFSLLLFSGAPLNPPANAEEQDSLKNLQEFQQRMEKQRMQEMEKLRQTSPEVYERLREGEERAQQLQEIRLSFVKQEISREEAERRMYPLFQQDLREMSTSLDARIARLEKKLARLREAKKDPDLLVKQKIDQFLDGVPPAPEELFE